MHLVKLIIISCVLIICKDQSSIANAHRRSYQHRHRHHRRRQNANNRHRQPGSEFRSHCKLHDDSCVKKIAKQHDHNKYYTYDELQHWLDRLEQAFPPELVNISSYGKSFENNNLRMLKIGYQNKNGTKPGLWIDGGIHAREWLAPSTAMYIINQLLFNSKMYDDLLNDMDFFILPLANPDGYMHSLKVDKLWRKTRSGPICKENGKCCYGVDANRNWMFKWGAFSSTDPCSEVYQGDYPESEPEVHSMARLMRSLKHQLQGMITLHSFMHGLLHSWGFAAHTYPDDIDDLIWMANQMAKAGENIGSPYINRTYEVIGAGDMAPGSGASDDYAKHIGVKYVYTMELPPGEQDQELQDEYGFAMPPQYIEPVAKQAWATLLPLAHHIAENGKCKHRYCELETGKMKLVRDNASGPQFASSTVALICGLVLVNWPFNRFA